MLLRKYFGISICFYLHIVHISCDEEGSLAFAIDDTLSMWDDIRYVKNAGKAIMEMFSKQKSSIKDFVLVTINDPHVKLQTHTSSNNVFLQHLNSIETNNWHNGDCPEMSLTGMKMALEESKPESYIFVFTDANAKDHYKLDEIKSLCQKKQSQVVIVYSIAQDCHNIRDVMFTVYYEVVKACSGQLFIVEKEDVESVLNAIKILLQGKNSIFKWITVPRSNTHYPVDFTLDEKAEYAIVSTSGEKVELRITRQKNYWSPEPSLERAMWNNNGKVVKLIHPEPGTYYAWVKGDSEVSVVVYGRTDFSFRHGFSVHQPKSMTDTAKQPIAGLKQHLSVNVTDLDNSVKIQTVQILDIRNNDRIINELPLRNIGKDFYITDPFVSPNFTFRIAVIGEIKNTHEKIRRTSRTNIDPSFEIWIPDSKPNITIDEGLKLVVDYGSAASLTCKVTAHPKPDIGWYSSSGRRLTTESYVIDDPLFVSYLKLTNIKQNETFVCKASNKNGKGKDSSIELGVRPVFTVTYKSEETVYNAKYGEDVKIPCSIRSYLPITIKWFKSGVEIRGNGNTEVYAISPDRSELTLKNMDIEMQGKYTCEATLNSDPTVKQTHNNNVKIPGLARPEIQSTNKNILVMKKSKLELKCKIDRGYPKPEIKWFKKNANSYMPLANVNSEVLIVNEALFSHAGQYKCEATNGMGTDNVEFDVTVSGLPDISVTETRKEILYNSNAEFTCTVKSYPTPSIVWTDEKGSVLQSKVTKNSEYEFSTRLQLLNVRRSAVYICKASNNDGSSTERVNIEVPPPFVVKEHIHGEIEINYKSKKTLRCDIKSTLPMIIRWYRQKSDVKASRSVISSSDKYTISDDGSELTIVSMDVNLAGRYTCEASLLSIPTEKVAYSVNIVGLQLPQIHNEEPVHYGLEGDLVMKILCNVTGFPEPTVTWKKEGKPLNKGLKYEIKGTTLYIMDPVKSDSAEYTCEAKNNLGTDNTSSIVEIVDNFEGYDEFNGDSNEDYAEKDSPKIIKCNLKNPGEGSVRWYLDGRPTNQTGSTYKIEKDSLSDVRNYTCRVNTDEGSKSETHVVYVGYSPYFQDNNIPSPITIHWDNDQQKLDCSAESEPPATYAWLHNGKTVIGDKQKPITDWGEYTCNVSNVLGNIQKTYKIETPGCFIMKHIATQNQPLVSDVNKPMWHISMGNNGILLAENEEIKFSCPKNTKLPNAFKVIPSKREVTAKCKKQDEFDVDGKNYKYSDLQCNIKVEPSVIATRKECSGLNTEMIRVGFEVNDFLEAYKVCYDRNLNVPLYATASARISSTNDGVELAELEWSSAPELGQSKTAGVERGSCECCYTKGQLVNINELPFGPGQAATLKDNLNSVPIWNPTCDDNTRTSWQTFDEDSRQKYLSGEYSTWTGASKYTRQDVGLVPRYLWKVIKHSEGSTVVVFVNDKTPDSNPRCSTSCYPILEADEYLYCCTLEEFSKKFDVALDTIIAVQ